MDLDACSHSNYIKRMLFWISSWMYKVIQIWILKYAVKMYWILLPLLFVLQMWPWAWLSRQKWHFESLMREISKTIQIIIYIIFFVLYILFYVLLFLLSEKSKVWRQEGSFRRNRKYTYQKHTNKNIYVLILWDSWNTKQKNMWHKMIPSSHTRKILIVLFPGLLTNIKHTFSHTEKDWGRKVSMRGTFFNKRKNITHFSILEIKFSLFPFPSLKIYHILKTEVLAAACSDVHNPCLFGYIYLHWYLAFP